MAQCGHDQCTWVGQVHDKDDHERRQCHRATGAGVSDHRHNQPNTVWPCVDLKKCQTPGKCDTPVRGCGLTCLLLDQVGTA